MKIFLSSHTTFEDWVLQIIWTFPEKRYMKRKVNIKPFSRHRHVCLLFMLCAFDGLQLSNIYFKWKFTLYYKTGSVRNTQLRNVNLQDCKNHHQHHSHSFDIWKVNIKLGRSASAFLSPNIKLMSSTKSFDDRHQLMYSSNWKFTWLFSWKMSICTFGWKLGNWAFALNH